MTEMSTQQKTSLKGTEMSEQQEQWREVTGSPGYEVSDMGRVRSWRVQGSKFGGKRTEPLILKSILRSDGRTQVSLSVNGKVKISLVHCLVLTAFMGERPEGMEGCHNNGNPEDNRLPNLRWDTPKGNAADKVLHGTVSYGSAHSGSKLTEEIVREARKVYVPRHPEFGASALARKYGVSQTVMSDAITGRSWSRAITDTEHDLAA